MRLKIVMLAAALLVGSAYAEDEVVMSTGVGST